MSPSAFSDGGPYPHTTPVLPGVYPHPSNDFETFGYGLGRPVTEKRLLQFDVFVLGVRLDAGPATGVRELVDRTYRRESCWPSVASGDVGG